MDRRAVSVSLASFGHDESQASRSACRSHGCRRCVSTAVMLRLRPSKDTYGRSSAGANMSVASIGHSCPSTSNATLSKRKRKAPRFLLGRQHRDGMPASGPRTKRLHTATRITFIASWSPGCSALLFGVDPVEVHKWYLAIYWDAVEWVEMPNVTGMSQFADGGLMGSKPYIASGKYIHRMSNYCESCRYNPEEAVGKDACPFTTLYWDFLLRHEEMLKANHSHAHAGWQFRAHRCGEETSDPRQAADPRASYAEGSLTRTRPSSAELSGSMHVRLEHSLDRALSTAPVARLVCLSPRTFRSARHESVRQFLGKPARDVEAARERRERGQHQTGAIHQEDRQLL